MHPGGCAHLSTPCLRLHGERLLHVLSALLEMDTKVVPHSLPPTDAAAKDTLRPKLLTCVGLSPQEQNFGVPG